MTDPGFYSRRRGRQPLILGQKPIIWQDVHRKLHENERNWTERGRIPGAPWIQNSKTIATKIVKQEEGENARNYNVIGPQDVFTLYNFPATNQT